MYVYYLISRSDNDATMQTAHKHSALRRFKEVQKLFRMHFRIFI